MLRWKQTGSVPVEHYGDGLTHELHYGLIEDAGEYDAFPRFHQPAVIFHGRKDDVVPPDYSITFAQRCSNVELHLLDSGHELIDVLDQMWQPTEQFLLG